MDIWLLNRVEEPFGDPVLAHISFTYRDVICWLVPCVSVFEASATLLRPFQTRHKPSSAAVQGDAPLTSYESQSSRTNSHHFFMLRNRHISHHTANHRRPKSQRHPQGHVGKWTADPEGKCTPYQHLFFRSIQHLGTYQWRRIATGVDFHCTVYEDDARQQSGFGQPIKPYQYIGAYDCLIWLLRARVWALLNWRFMTS